MASDDDQHLRRFLACRDAGDEAGARAAWEALLTAEWPRLKGFVELSNVLYDRAEREEALGLAALKLWKDMITTFRGTTKGEWVNAVKTCVRYAAHDVQRDAARRRGREEVGLDDDEAATWRHDRFAREQEKAAATDFVAWALPQIAHERQRHVLQRSLEGATTEDLMAELDTSSANIYKLRQRGLEALATLKEQWDA